MIGCYSIGILVIVLILIVCLCRKKQVIVESDEPTSINVFPDYSRDLPLEARLGDRLNFVVKGYIDKDKLQEITLFEKEIVWQHQNYVGSFAGETKDKVEGGINVQYVIPNEKEHLGKLVYVTARYHGLKDTTWIKITEE